MGRFVFRLPDIGEGIAEAEIVAWHVKPGDLVEEDGRLADLMTDKATVEMESPVAGTVLEVAGEVGDVIAIGSPLVVLETEGDAAEERVAAPAPVPPAIPPSGSGKRSSASGRPSVSSRSAPKPRAARVTGTPTGGAGAADGGGGPAGSAGATGAAGATGSAGAAGSTWSPAWRRIDAAGRAGPGSAPPSPPSSTLSASTSAAGRGPRCTSWTLIICACRP